MNLFYLMNTMINMNVAISYAQCPLFNAKVWVLCIFYCNGPGHWVIYWNSQGNVGKQS